MAFLLLGTAHLSWMDPQITNLVPVLKSYWLVIHVATITASYAFLGLGALLAAFNLILMIMVTRKSFQFIDLTIQGNIQCYRNDTDSRFIYAYHRHFSWRSMGQ